MKKPQINGYIIGIFLILISLFIIGCHSAATKEMAADLKSNDGYTVTDCTGTNMTFATKPERIISLTISTDEILMDLVPKERIVGLSYLADDPGISNITEKSQGINSKLYGNNGEAIIALRPDLVIVADFFKPEMIQTLRDFGIKVYVYKTQTDMERVKASIREIAQVVGEVEKAEPLIEMMDRKLAEIERKVKLIPGEKRKRVVYIKVNGASFRPQSSFHDICKFAGVKDATLELQYEQAVILSKEEVVTLNPDVFVLTDWNYDGKHDPKQLCKEIQEDPAYQTITAIKNKQVIALPGSHMQALSHYIVYAVEDMAKQIYPELF